MNVKQTLLAGLSLLVVQTTPAAGKDAATGTRKLLDTTNMDRSVKPGDNFFMFANGTWLHQNPIPPSETRWGSFNELQENNYAALHELLEQAAKAKSEKNTPNQIVGDFYKSGMDLSGIEQAGLKPLSLHFARIDALSDLNGLMKEIALEHTEGISPVFGFYVSPDDKNVVKQMPQFFQGGLGMPDRDYYFKNDDRSSKVREGYKSYMTNMMRMMGIPDVEQAAKAVYELESKLAEASMTRVEMRDPYKLYNKFSISGNAQKEMTFPWPAMFKMMQIGQADSMIVGQPRFFTVVGQQFSKTPLTTWKNYLKFHLVSDMAPYLSKAFDSEHFRFYGTVVRGQQEQKERWKRVLQVVDNSVGELLGQMYVGQHFKPEAKKRMLDLVNNLQSTYADRIKRLPWMSEPTKKKALAKLGTFLKKIGYPDKWRDYQGLEITADNYVQNILHAARFEYNYTISKLGKPVDRMEWQMTPPTVNAYYNPAFNEIVFPAGILQYPFFEMSGDDAVNYGGIGAVIGHEMTHGFDDQGRQYDADGNLNDWWQEEDAKQFKERADKVIAQFNGYKVLDTVSVNGELTLGENLADLGGLAISYEAFKKTAQGKNGKAIDGLTPDQRFFLSWAQVWRASTRPEEMANRIVTDPHSPNEWRCNGPLSNVDAWYQAFDIKPGDKMYKAPKDRISVW